MLNKMTAYHQMGKMVIIEIVWMWWPEYYSREWSIICELQISWVIFVDAVSYPILSVSWIYFCSITLQPWNSESVSEVQIAKFYYLFLTPFLK